MKVIAAYAVAVSALLAGAASAAEGIDAEALVNADCMSCHGNEVYTRDDRRVQSYAGLQQQIDRCIMATPVDWNAQQKAAVVEYLNRTYYHFER